MLILAVHNVEEVSARIPFCMMVLNDVLSRQAVLPGLKARFLIPTSGTTSVSVWDATDIPTLQTWLDETLSEYCTTQVSSCVLIPPPPSSLLISKYACELKLKRGFVSNADASAPLFMFFLLLVFRGRGGVLSRAFRRAREAKG